MERKVENLSKHSIKINDYYEQNHLKVNSVLDMVARIESLEKAIEQKANSLDLKKLTSA